MANERELQGNYVARMEIGDTPGFRNEYLHQLIEKYSKSGFRYSPSQGELTLRESVVESQWPDSSPEDIVIGPANFLITAGLAACTSENDYILLPDPGFPTYRLAANLLGLRVIYYPVFKTGRGFFPDLDAFVSDLKIKPKAIIINNPSNPLGIAFPAHEVEFHLRNFENLGISVIIDETYVNLIYDDTNAVLSGITAIRIRSFSKEHCAPGLRVGYCLASSKQIKTISDFMSLSISCIPQFIQLAVAEYLVTPYSLNFAKQVRSEIERRFQLMINHLPKDCLKQIPNSTFYSLLNVGDGQECFKYLLTNNVATCPGYTFGLGAAETVRVSLAGSIETIETDLEMLGEALVKWYNLRKS
jgi:aspartate aminotransferase